MCKNPLTRWRQRRVSRALTAQHRNRIGDTRVSYAPVSDGLTWRCDVCGNERPDRFISVFTRRRPGPHGILFHENIKFCNDNLKCATGAPEVYYLDPPVDPTADDEGEVVQAWTMPPEEEM